MSVAINVAVVFITTDSFAEKSTHRANSGRNEWPI
jgi:hypothetical protein